MISNYKLFPNGNISQNFVQNVQKQKNTFVLSCHVFNYACRYSLISRFIVSNSSTPSLQQHGCIYKYFLADSTLRVKPILKRSLGPIVHNTKWWPLWSVMANYRCASNTLFSQEMAPPLLALVSKETILKRHTRIKGHFQAIFQDLFLIIFVGDFLNVDYIEFYYLAQNMHNDYQLWIHSIFQNIAKFRWKCAKKTKKTSILSCYVCCRWIYLLRYDTGMQ